MTLSLEDSSGVEDIILSKKIKFWLYLLILIPSILCTLFVLYFLLFDRNFRRALNNHVIIILLILGLICQVTIYPWMLYFYQSRDTWQRSHILCSIDGFIGWGLYITQTILFAWASIERHILIFHDTWLVTRRQRLFLHYFPLVFLLLYCIIFYSIVYLFPPCDNIFDNLQVMCVISCLLYDYVWNMWETIVNQILPILIIITFSLALLIRVVRQKQRLHQPIQWRKHRKMAVQLLTISLLYLLFFLPLTMVILLYLCGLVDRIGWIAYTYTVFLSYFVILLFPFVCILSLRELQRKIKNIIPYRRCHGLVTPEIVVIAYNQNVRQLKPIAH